MELPLLTEIEQKTTSQPSPRRKGLRLWRVEVLNWGTLGENVVHGTDLAGGWLCITGRNGAGKSTLADAIVTAFPPANARIHYNAAGGARNTKERTRETYLRGFFGSEQDDSGRSKPSALRTKAGTLTAILLQFHEEGTTRWATALVLGTFDAKGDHWLYGIVDRKETLEVVKGTEDWDARAKRLRKSGWQIGAEPGPYRDRLRELLRIPSEKAITTFVRTVGMKDIGDVNIFIRQNMLDDVSVHDRYVELTKHYQKQIEIDDEIELTRRMIETLRPLSGHVPKLRELGKKLSRKAALLAATEWRAKKDSADILAGIVGTLQSKVKSASGEIVQIEAEKTRMENELTTLRASEPAQRSRALAERAEAVDKRRHAVKEASNRLRQDLQDVGKITFPSNATDFAEMLKQLELIVADSDASEEERASAVFKEKAKLEELKADFKQLENEIQEARESGSSLLPRDIQSRAIIAHALGLKNTDLPFVGELVDVLPAESEWRVALEKLLRTYARRILVPDAHMTRVLAFVNATRFEKHRVRLERVSSKSPFFTLSPSDSKSACAKLRVKPNHPFANWLTNELKAKFDYSCFKSVAEYERHRGAALTIDGLFKGGSGDYHEKRDDIEIVSARDHFLGWDNEEKIRALRADLAKIRESITTAEDEVAEARRRNEVSKGRRDAAKSVLDSVKTFESVDMGSVNADLASIEKERSLLAVTDPEAANIEQNVQSLLGQIDGKATQAKNLVSSKGGDEKLIEQYQAEILEIETWEGEHERPPEDDLHDVASFFTPIPSEARQLAKWAGSIERAVRDHFDEVGKEHSNVALEIKGVMSGYLTTFPNERKTLNDIITAADAFLERLRELEEEKLHELQERFREHLKGNLALHVSQLKSLLQTEVGKSKRRIEEINKILATISWEGRRVTQIFPRQNPEADIKRFEELMNSASAPLLAPTNTEKENAFGAVKELIKFLESENTRKLVLDARNWLLFAVAWPDLSIEDPAEQRKTSNARENTDGLSGGQKNKLSVTLLASALAFQYDVAGVNARPGTFRTVLIDEAFAKLDSENARYALELFKQFDFQLVLVHPLDGTVRVAEDYVNAFLLATIREGKFSSLTPVAIEDFKRLVDEASKESPMQP